ncbi:Bcsmi1 [Botrytis cinerea B05.10]|uniref:Bcsmi1 n=3 Tax=Botryotinia fuckeliana TaxID=40559 RepID=A0A384K789_BOTFB|nr:Bcsmi1 [Botrytis cinerea B05.10]ATZ58407.1 Bcsmi1 [Botrytis cinerea B05.10]EMR83364.1 putative glucan synthesis regulatory protein [Botrytis cinerea BcDW1]CCD48750.1 similar to 1,3-beta-glucan biosynthesis protein [Botrytis cinerea T4]
MAGNPLGSAFKSFWHTMTSYDRHSSHDSPYRTGGHVPLAQSRHEPLTSVATTASESRADLNSPYFEDSGRQSTSALNGNAYPGSPFAPPASPGPQSPYSPGMRSSTLQRQSTQENFENVTPGEIQLQAFQEGLPPPPPVGHSWKRIDRWAEENYEELFDQLCEGCTNNDLNELEHQLDCSLPMEVRESMQLHDGQERGGLPTGIIFGSMLLDCEEIVQEWESWKKVNQEYLVEQPTHRPSIPPKALGGSSSSSSKQPANAQNPYWRQDLLARQDSQPPNAIQKVYAHPAWIPLVRDWGGNNLAVDLAPGPAGKWGQVILFGRDYDCKYVVARSWSAFLATVADDLSSGKWFVDEETNDLKLREFKSGKVEPGYFDILRWRMDQKYGRKNVRRRSAPPVNGNGGSPTGSPYASPAAEIGEPRGRSMQRFSGASPIPSPNRPGYGKSSPLAQVAEEGSGSGTKVSTIDIPSTKLVDVQTPRPSEENKSSDRPFIESESPNENKENEKASEKVTGLGLVSGTSEKETPADDESAMKTIEI